MHTTLILVAGGQGLRAGGVRPKQYQYVGPNMVLTHAIRFAAASERIDSILPVIAEGADDLFAQAISPLTPDEQMGVLPPVHGGRTRQGSTQRGVAALPPETTHILVHDAARPFLPAQVVHALLDAISPGVAAIPTLAVPDSVKRIDEMGLVIEDSDRSGLVRAQTPQAFLRSDLVEALSKADVDTFTDEASLARASGLKIVTVQGSESLFKVTHPNDFRRAESYRMAQMMDIRTGLGFDVHAFEDGHGVRLCGVMIDHAKTLKGHSDADVGLHAVTDALLGAIAEGDIGDHFPPSDARWKGAASEVFLTYARDLIRKKNGQIAHVDVTLICEQPKIGPHRSAMKEAIATWLEIEKTRVSIKATTTEKLGFTGRQEGIAAQAIATVRLPAA